MVSLQAGDAETMRHWQRLVDLSKVYLNTIYRRLGVTLTDDDIRGESFYDDMLADTAEQLSRGGLAVTSDGARSACSRRGSRAATAIRCQ